MSSNNTSECQQGSRRTSQASSSLDVSSNDSTKQTKRPHSSHAANVTPSRMGTSASNAPVGQVPVAPMGGTRPPAAMRRLHHSSSTVAIRGPPSSTGRPNNVFIRPAPRSTPLPVVHDAWKNGDEVSVRVRGLPPNITTLELWKVFETEGTVDYIEIFEDGLGRKDGSARVRFRPPPKRSFWNRGKYPFRKTRGHALYVDVSLEARKHDFFVLSPVNPMIRYPATTLLNPVSINFGFMYDATTMVAMHSSNSQRTGSITFQLDLSRKFIDVRFELQFRDPRGSSGIHWKKDIPLHKRDDSVGSLNRNEKYRFRIPIEQLHVINEVEGKTQERSLIISLETPPSFYRKAGGPQLIESHDEKTTFWSEFHTWFRQTDIVYNPRELKHASIALKKAQPMIDIGRWTTYRFTFPKSECTSPAYRTLVNALRDYNVIVERSNDFKMSTHRPTPVWEWIDPPTSKVSLPVSSEFNSPVSLLAELQSTTIGLSYPIRYQLEVCISQGRLNEHNLGRDFIERLSQMDEKKVLDVLKHVAQQKRRIYDPMSIFELKLNESPTSGSKIPHYCALTRKATVTPTMIYFGTPVVETSNRVVRQYLEHSDRFLRVQFTDEKHEGRINSTEKNMNNEVFTRIRRTLINGITIGDRHFEFLAFGNSQFREHGAFFFAPTAYLKTEDILHWMGNFSRIRSVARYASRLGQCFSTTRAISGTKVEVQEIHDVKKGKYNFTDGVGKISESLAKLVAGELRLPNVPSVFQYRLGGCKGILAVWPAARKWEIHIRESQYKFPAIHNGLEIIRCSQFAAAALNRQVILVLSALGVPDAVFVNKMKDMLSNLERAMVEENLLLEMLQKHVDPNQMTLTLAGMVSWGFMRAKEPFLMSVLQLWRAWTIKNVKERARIIIDDGAFLIGCTDETRTLRGQLNQPYRVSQDSPPNFQHILPEIFLQIPDPNQAGRYKVIEGLCLLGRNPSLHPGDIRVVMAVDKPELRHIRDAVVLPQTGDRDVASMCSGGDLDGDDFFVMWDKDLLPREWNHPTMDYSAPTPATLKRPVQKDDITSFFVQYMRNDCLPRIAHAHMAFADLMDRGVKDEKCLRLAGLHSKAVDYVKTGEPANMPRDLVPRRWPHFMEKRHQPKEKIYISRKVLGQLYDQVERVDFVPVYHLKFDSRILNAYELNDDQLQAAREIKEKYDADMRRIMAQHGIGSEFEVWSTFVLNHDHSSRDYKFHEEIGQIAFALKDRYRDMCIDKAGGRGFDVLGPFVAAMYRVTQEEITAAVEETREIIMVDGKTVPKRQLVPSSMPLMSFPWCFTDVLGRLSSMGAVIPEGIRPVEVIQTSRDSSSKEKQAEVVEDSKPKKDQRESRRDKSPPLINLEQEDVIETAEGLTHRGEILELFHDGFGADMSPVVSEPNGGNVKPLNGFGADMSPAVSESSGGNVKPVKMAQHKDERLDVAIGLTGSTTPQTLDSSETYSSSLGSPETWESLEQVEDRDGSEVGEEEIVTIEESDGPTALEALEKLVLGSGQSIDA